MSLCDKLKEIRKEACLTQLEIAALLKTRQTTISKYELGTAKPSFKVLKMYIKLSKKFNLKIKLDDFFEE